MIAFIEKAKLTDRWRDGFIPDGSTFVNNQRWKDDLGAYSKPKPPKGSPPDGPQWTMET